MKNKFFLLTALLAVAFFLNVHANNRKKYNFNSEWCLWVGDMPAARCPDFDDKTWKKVTLPHAFNEDESFRLSIEQHTDTVVWYRKHFQLEDVKGKRSSSSLKAYGRQVSSI